MNRSLLNNKFLFYFLFVNLLSSVILLNPNNEIGEYIIDDIIGKGDISNVYLAHSKTNKELFYAIKEIISYERFSNYAKMELEIIKKIKHRNLVKIDDYIYSSKKLYLVMELCKQGDLLFQIQNNGKSTEIFTREVISQILNALDYLHNKKNIAHKNIKPQNILLFEENTFKLSDIGISIPSNALVTKNG
ncbi:MAG: protein kinase, partial [archaeon]|nr:protein kinase [archaeon]